MKTFEYCLFVNKEQSHKLMACLAESRAIYNGMLEAIEAIWQFAINREQRLLARRLPLSPR